MKTAFPTIDVLTVVAGIMLKKGADFQGVMNHLYPGIFTFVCAAMQPNAAEEIQRQHPKIREFCRVNAPPESDNVGDEWCDDFMQLARIAFGETIEIDGPIEVTNGEIVRAFAGLSQRIPSDEEVDAK